MTNSVDLVSKILGQEVRELYEFMVNNSDNFGPDLREQYLQEQCASIDYRGIEFKFNNFFCFN